MGMLKITDCTGQHFTCVDHAFIDSYMAKANGEYVKVYLLLLRRMESSSPFSVSEFAEILDNTEGDIIRALKYWAKKGLLTIEYGPDGEMRGLQMDAPQKAFCLCGHACAGQSGCCSFAGFGGCACFFRGQSCRFCSCGSFDR